MSHSTEDPKGKRQGKAKGRPLDELPPALPSMWRALKRGFEAEPWLISIAFGLALLAALPDALLALWLKLLADGLLEEQRGLVMVASIGLGVSAAATWFLRVISDRTQRRFRDRVTIALESHVARLQADVSTIEHHERPEFLDRLAMLRDQVFVLDHMYMSLFTTCGWILRLVVTLVLLFSVHPLLSLLVLAAIPTVVMSTWRPGVERAVEERGTVSRRLARHLFELATTAAPGKEVRVTNTGDELARRQREALDTWYRPVASTRWTSAFWHSFAWLIFGLAFVGAVVFVASGGSSSPATSSPGNVLLVLAAGSRLSAYVSAAVGEIGFLRGFWLEGSKRMAWLEDYAAALAEHSEKDVPRRLDSGITLENVSFAYPGTERNVLEDVDLHLEAGSVVALVGENGAGKSTLVKLLCRMYAPGDGRILVDDVELARVPAPAWRERLAGAFQDFHRFEVPAQHTVGLGDLPRLDDRPSVERAVARADAGAVVDSLPSGLDSQLGPTWPGGVEVSFGQWQKLALARGFMRDEPLLLVLDEPTAALDAETEHSLFERFAAAARGNSADSGESTGRITILVSHRFSTVRMADRIVVLDGARVAEVGSHDELMAAGGQYSELYSIQAESYGL